MSQISRVLFSKIVVVICLMGLATYSQAPWAGAKTGAKAAAAAIGKASPLTLVQAGKYAEALPDFKEMARKNPRDPSINYYLGLCAESVHDYDLAENSFCKVIVGTSPASPFVPLAARQLSALPNKLQPQCALYEGQLHEWDRKAYPLRIYFSDGRTIAREKAGMGLTPDEFRHVVATAQANIGSMPISPSFKPTIPALVAEGIRGWDWAAREKRFSYTYTRDPRQADIIVLYSELPTGWTQWPVQKGLPTLLWIGLDGPGRTDNLYKNGVRDITAHEFGHCLGLNHSSAKGDLMLPITYVVNMDDRQSADALASPSDKASMRALLSMPPDVTF